MSPILSSIFEISNCAIPKSTAEVAASSNSHQSEGFSDGEDQETELNRSRLNWSFAEWPTIPYAESAVGPQFVPTPIPLLGRFGWSLSRHCSNLSFD
jgi:hypothetical protein